MRIRCFFAAEGEIMLARVFAKKTQKAFTRMIKWEKKVFGQESRNK